MGQITIAGDAHSLCDMPNKPFPCGAKVNNAGQTLRAHPSMLVQTLVQIRLLY